MQCQLFRAASPWACFLEKCRTFHFVGLSIDACSPPYETDARPDPLQMYGRQKLSGEKEILKAKEAGANAHILRIPIL